MSDLNVTVIYVSWRDTDMLLRSLASLAASTRDRPEQPMIDVVVVANEIEDGAERRIALAWPNVVIIGNRENRGFGPAANQGAAAANREILLFLNPDTLALGTPIPTVVSAFATHPSPVAIAPRLVESQLARGETQEAFQLRRLPSLGTDARELLLIDHIIPGNGWRRRARYLDRDRDHPFRVEQAAAAALAVRREAFEAIGGFDERFVPAYWEDVDLCKRLAPLGAILYWPDARFEHVGGVSAVELGDERFRTMYYRNALRYRAKHYSTGAQLIYRLLLLVGTAMRTVAVLGMGRRKSGRGGVLRGFASVARLALRPDLGDPGP